MSMTNETGNGRGLWRPAMWAALAGLLAVPLVAMQFTTEMNWTLSDFVFAGILLALVGIGVEIAMRVTRKALYRVLIAGAVLAGVLVLWADGAVGIF
jgi:hypothetical protein